MGRASAGGVRAMRVEEVWKVPLRASSCERRRTCWDAVIRFSVGQRYEGAGPKVWRPADWQVSIQILDDVGCT